MFERVEETAFTPAISVDSERNCILIKGKSYPENISVFYDPFLEYLTELLKEDRAVILDIELVYFNSSSSKVLMNIFDMLEEAAKRGIACEVNWRYEAENELAKECGEEFQEDYSAFEFKLSEI